MDRNRDIWSSISSVLDGNPTEEEMHEVESWITEDEGNRQLFNSLNNTDYNKAVAERAFASQESVFLKTQMKIKETILHTKLRIWKSVAAASIIFLLIAGGHMIFRTDSFTPVWVESRTPAGNITTLALSDGTIVSLNASSSISYPLYFNEKERRVKLNGEAYFEVARDSGHPFIVETDHIKINVLGTSFNVKSYEEDEMTVMTLLEGSVSIEVDDLNLSGKKPVILTPGQQIVVDKNSREIQLLQVKPELYSSWKEGQCYFENEKFIHITKILERQFGVIIRITSPNLENQLYSGFFGKKEGVLQILNSFRKYRNFDYRQDETGIEIYEK